MADEAPRGETTYTVQMLKEALTVVDSDGHETPMPGAWVDIATVTVPRKSPRRRACDEALRQSGIKPAPNAEPLRLRALDAASAEETTFVPYQPEALWRVS